MGGRLFVALPAAKIPEPEEGRLRAWLGEIPGLRIAASRHVTLAFLGECESEEADRARLACAAAAASRAPFRFLLDRLTGLPSPAAARVAVLQGAARAPLRALVTDLRARMALAGVACDARPFLLHMTVGRMQKSVQMAEHAVGPLRFYAQEFHLLRSELHPCGAHHELVARFRLSGC